jgi:glycosyltransferase involved in cell wall biosynthesis
VDITFIFVTDDLIDVVLPCLDEAGALPDVLKALPGGYRAIVVDNGSSDGSPEVAVGLGAKLLREPRRGYGAAVHTGLASATADIVCFCDADGSLDLAELPRLVDTLLRTGADLVVGGGGPTDGGVWPWHARAGNLMLAFLLRRKGLPVRDIASMRAGRREALLALGVTDRAFGYPLELLIKAERAGWVVRELDVAYGERAQGTRSKVSGSVRGTLRAVRDMGRALAR